MQWQKKKKLNLYSDSVGQEIKKSIVVLALRSPKCLEPQPGMTSAASTKKYGTEGSTYKILLHS